MRSCNPVLSANTFERFDVYDPTRTMTIEGTATKTGMLLLLVVAAAAFTWGQFFNDPETATLWIIGGGLGGLVLALITVFKQQWSPVTAPMYAVVEGLFLGAISAMYNTFYYEARFGSKDEAVAGTCPT